MSSKLDNASSKFVNRSCNSLGKESSSEDCMMSAVHER